MIFYCLRTALHEKEFFYLRLISFGLLMSYIKEKQTTNTRKWKENHDFPFLKLSKE